MEKEMDNKIVNIVLLAFPVLVGLFMIVEGVIWRAITGYSLLGIPPAVAAMLMVISMFTIPFAILNGALRNDK